MSGMYVCLALVLCFPALIPQQKAVSQRKDPSYDLWLVRSQTLTEELLKDSANLEPLQRSLVFAKLAQRWWFDNPEKSRSWMTAAIATVEAVPNRENPDEHRKRINTARQLLQIATPLDQKFSARLVAILKETDKQSGNEEHSANAQALLDAALALVDSNPARAVELGGVALGVDHSSNVDSLILSLRPKNAKLADALLSQALALARQTLEVQLLMNLTRATFPAEMQLGTRAPPPPETFRAELLQLDVAYLQSNPIDRETRTSVCLAVIGFIVPVLPEFDRRLPQQAPAVRQAVNQCQSLSPLAQQRIDDALRSQPLTTVEELIKAAQDSEDIKVKTVYEYRAATLAMEKKDYERAITILEGISAEGREFMGTMWAFFRWDWASLAAVDYYNRGDFSAMRHTINAVPEDLKAYAKLAFIDRLPDKRNEDADPSLEFLRDARKELASAYGSETERYSWYFALLRPSFKYAPQDSPAILKEAIAALNRAEQTNENSAQNEEAHHRETSGIWKNLAGSLIDMDEYALKDAVTSINSTQTRVDARLELLQACLERMRARH